MTDSLCNFEPRRNHSPRTNLCSSQFASLPAIYKYERRKFAAAWQLDFKLLAQVLSPVASSQAPRHRTGSSGLLSHGTEWDRIPPGADPQSPVDVSQRKYRARLDPRAGGGSRGF